ncbi:MAG: hypothetical protein ACREM6_15470, partial [Vulcanimicrobiaceae bacterium]
LYDKITIAVTFAQDVSSALPAPGSTLSQPGQLGVLIGFDSDGNDATGTYGGCGLSGTPFEFNLDPGNFGRRADGGYNILGQNPAGQPTGSEATVSVNGRTITFTIQLAAVGVGGPNIPKLKVQVVAFNGVHPALNYPLPTDCAPDAGEIATGT